MSNISKFGFENVCHGLIFIALENSVQSSESLGVEIYYLNPSIPDAPNWRISAFEKKSGKTERSWIVAKGRGTLLLSEIEAGTSVTSNVLAQLKKTKNVGPVILHHNSTLF